MQGRRSRLLAGALVLLAVVGIDMLFVHTGRAQAHGSMTYPTSRTHACYEDGKQGGNGGDLAPTNAACAAAVAEGGKQPLWDWFGDLLSNAGGRSREIIPDGHLCGPQPTYDPYNQPRADWPTTTLQSGAPITFRYNAWAQHPGTWTQWVTRDGFDVTQPLKWSDLDPTPFNSVDNPPVVAGEYVWNAQLPVKSGRHVLYSIWQRSDSPEAFYSCSDVIFTGGVADTAAPTAPGAPTASTLTRTTAALTWPAATDDVVVGRYEVYREAGDIDALVASPTEAAATVPDLAPDTGYTFYVVAVDAAGNRSAASAPVQVTTPAAPPPGDCAVSYTRTASWPGGYTAILTVRNTGATPLTSWTLDFDFPAGQQLRDSWSSEMGVTGTVASAHGVDWNADIAPGQSAEFGYNAATTGPVAVPDLFTIGGRACTV